MKSSHDTLFIQIEGGPKMRKTDNSLKNSNKVMMKFSNKFFESAIFSIIAIVVIIAAMYLVTGFYENSYPYNTIAQLPRNNTTFLLNIFNGYTEKVPSTANLSTIMNQINTIRQSATDNVNNAVEDWQKEMPKWVQLLRLHARPIACSSSKSLS
jgi:hypothetical protein